MTIPVIAALTAALLAILQAGLMLNVGLHRIRHKVGVGIGDDLHLERKIRRHANLAENAALFIVLLALAEMTVVPVDVVRILAAVFVLGRIFHAIGFSSLAGSHAQEGNKIFPLLRALGAIATFGTMAATAIYILISLA